MKKDYNVDLSKYTTFKVGGIARNFFVPESTEELIEIAKNLKSPLWYIGGGSNLLINDKKIFENVINLRCFNERIENRGNGIFKVGASVRLQKMINAVNQEGYGGIEYLYSVPGLVGGAIYMNAGRGRKFNQAISDYLIEVEVLDNGERYIIKRDACNFNYRQSIFQERNLIILSALFKFEKTDVKELENRKKDRLKLVSEKQDNSTPNFGTVFSLADSNIMKLFRKTWLGKCGAVHFSTKTSNWMLKEKGGEYSQAIKLLKRVEFLHKVFHKKYKREVIIWE